MRPSIARFSDMPGGKVYNPWWGDPSVLRQKGVVQYTLSPFQSRAAPHMLRNYLFNGYRRLSAEALFFIIPFGTGYAIYSWANSYEAFLNSKAGHVAAEAH